MRLIYLYAHRLNLSNIHFHHCSDNMVNHNDLVQLAKKEQVLRLRQSQALSKQLISTIIHFNRQNSDLSNLIDKITTIHALNKEIDKQLNEDFAFNFYEMKKVQRQMLSLIDKLYKVLYGGPNLIDELQSRVELIDQDLRILETTVKLVKQRQGHLR